MTKTYSPFHSVRVDVWVGKCIWKTVWLREESCGAVLPFCFRNGKDVIFCYQFANALSFHRKCLQASILPISSS